jgi:iron complex transport system ATP-binding protein
MINLKNINYAYTPEIPVLKDINIDIHKGYNTIIGPNGSGKTTLMKIMCGLINLQEGSVQIDGTLIDKMTNIQRAKKYTIIRQNTYFPFPFTSMEMVSFGRYPYKRNINALEPEDYDVIIDVMKKTDTLMFKDKIITELSGGEQQRVLLAAALAQEPEILFLDEAFSALDISYTAKFVELLLNLIKEKDITVVSIMHDLNIAYRFSDRIILIHNGEVKDTGLPGDVMTTDIISKTFDVNLELIEGKGFYINI